MPPVGAPVWRNCRVRRGEGAYSEAVRSDGVSNAPSRQQSQTGGKIWKMKFH